LSKEGIRCEIPSKITEDPSYQDLLSIYHDCTESDPEKKADSNHDLSEMFYISFSLKLSKKFTLETRNFELEPKPLVIVIPK